MAVRTIEWKQNRLKIIDQTKLPQKLVYLNLDNVKDLWRAVKELKVRGAPAIGIAAAFGVVLGTRGSRAKTARQFLRELDTVGAYLKRARPTAVNLFWAVDRMRAVAAAHSRQNVSFLKSILLQEAALMLKEDKDICRNMARWGEGLISDGDRVLTHCNAGALATADYGTALGVLYEARKQGKKFTVFADETRPVLQGARLTAWELLRHKIDVTLICDNMAAQLMREKRVDKILVGADRIAANGDTANKIGTYSLAVLAHFHHIPLYVAAPVSTFDFSIKTGKDIPIEQRCADEIRKISGKLIAPREVKVYNPAFDVTPHQLITAIITERGISRPPYGSSLKEMGHIKQK